MEIEVDVRVLDQRLEQRLERVARIKRAVAVIDVVGHAAAGRPGEQHRGDIDPRVMNDLGEAVDRFLEAGVEAMDENEDPAARRALDARIKVRFRLSQVHPVGAQDDEIALRISGDRGRKLNVAGLARAVRRDGHDDVGEIEPPSPRAAEHDAGRLDDRGARRRHEKVDLAGVGRGRPDDKGAVRTARTAGG